jgi:mRNA-degrading endonuclease RelE of RelBE toxin-antitoxin system
VAYAIRFDDETDDQLSYLTARQRATIFDAVERQLSHEPTVETRNRKRMQMDKPGFIASWELRVGNLRVYYDVEDGPPATVLITAVGVKVRSRVRIGGQEYEA